MHIPVLLKEVVDYLNPKAGEFVLDATIGEGGHARALSERVGEKGILIGIDQDGDNLKNLESKIKNKEFGSKFILLNGNFRDLDKLLTRVGVKKIDKALFDFGISAMHLEESGRGFSFQKDEPLLMTLKSEIGPNDLTAKEIVNKWPEEKIADVLYQYSEEKFSRRIARAIVERRKEKRIETTAELVNIIRVAVPAMYRNPPAGGRRINCCTRTFQALRIAVNDELNALQEGIEKAFDLISAGGKLAAISFHSLEDRIVKNFFRKLKEEKRGIILTKKPIVPSEKEVKNNSASRSAKLRVIEKI